MLFHEHLTAVKISASPAPLCWAAAVPMHFTLKPNKQVQAGTGKRDLAFPPPSVVPLAAQRTAKGKAMREEQRPSGRHRRRQAEWDKASLRSARDQKIKGMSWSGPDNSPAGNTEDKQVKMQTNKSLPRALRPHKSRPQFVPFGIEGNLS